MSNKILAVAVVLGMISAAAFAADISGKWITEPAVRGGGEPTKITYTFKAKGSNLTGSAVGPLGNENPISEGKITGDDISFVVTVSAIGMKVKYKGKVAGDEIRLTMEYEGGMMSGPGGGGSAPKIPVVLKRAK
jgi:hypothetical protein